MEQVIIIGGGLAGLVSAIALRRKGFQVKLIEKKSYPFHRVCGEYISREVIPFMQSLEIYPGDTMEVAEVTRLMVTSPGGKALSMPLDLGGFGISRYQLDWFLYQKAKAIGVEFLLETTVQQVIFDKDSFRVVLQKEGELEARVVIGSHGKRSVLDKQLNRKFMQARSPYLGVKYHIRTDFPSDLIALHNFKDGYCGISKVENDTYNLCYLTTRNNLKAYGKISQMEEAVLYENPYLKGLFANADFLFDRPEVINEISFAPKTCVQDHVLMAGDAAGLITPLCGNGMAMAIHGAKIVTEHVTAFLSTAYPDREKLEVNYTKAWRTEFANRLAAGRNIQKLFGDKFLTEIAVGTLNNAKPVARWLLKQTHGQPF